MYCICIIKLKMLITAKYRIFLRAHYLKYLGFVRLFKLTFAWFNNIIYTLYMYFLFTKRILCREVSISNCIVDKTASCSREVMTVLLNHNTGKHVVLSPGQWTQVTQLIWVLTWQIGYGTLKLLSVKLKLRSSMASM